jgi:hypothetical protein
MSSKPLTGEKTRSSPRKGRESTPYTEARRYADDDNVSTIVSLETWELRPYDCSF